jgi:hypothetical protein
MRYQYVWLNSLKHIFNYSICTICFNIKCRCMFPTENIFGCLTILIITSHYFPKQPELICFSNGYAGCLYEVPIPFLAHFPLFKNRVGLWDHVAVRVCVCISSPIVARQRLGKSPLSLLSNGSVKIPTISCVYYEITLLSVCLPVCVHIIVWFSMRVLVVSKESRRLVLLGTSC